MEASDALYQAVLRRERTFDGISFIGIKSTGVVCFPSCHSRIPRRENIVVFSRVEDALNAGFRPCKRCRPDSGEGQTPEVSLASRAEKLLFEFFPEPVSLNQAAERLHVSARQLSRTVRRVWQMSWHERQDMLWRERASCLLAKRKMTVGEVARTLRTTPSYFARRFVKLTGETPGAFRQRPNGEGWV